MESSRKRDRAAGGGDTASADAPNHEAPDRVTLHVGSETFVTCRATLEPASSYFARRFSAEWSSGVPSEGCFLDRDADSFRVLLSFMRCGHVSVLPRDPALFSRVLLDAEYFGIDSLIEQVKVKVQRHLHSKYVHTRFGQVALSGDELASVEARWTAAAFDEEHGGLREALDTTWLVDRFFATKPPTCSKIVQLLPALKTDRVVICESDEPDQQYSRRVHAFALVEHGGDREGARDVVPVVATNRDDADGGDDDTLYANPTPLDLASEIPNAIEYGWFMAGRNDLEPYP